MKLIENKIWLSLNFLQIIFMVIFAVINYSKLPCEVAVQWNNGSVTNTVSRKIIFISPLLALTICLLQLFNGKEKMQFNLGVSSITTFVLLLLQLLIIFNARDFIQVEIIFGKYFEIILSIFVGIVLIASSP